MELGSGSKPAALRASQGPLVCGRAPLGASRLDKRREIRHKATYTGRHREADNRS